MDKVQADLEKAEARFTLRPGRVLDVEQVRAAVKKAGFTPTWIAFTAKGVLAAREGGWAVELQDPAQVIRLDESEGLKRLREAGAAGKRVTAALKILPGTDRAVVETFTIP